MNAWPAAALGALLTVAPSASAQTQWPTEGIPRPLPAREVQFPPYELQTLPNGLQVVAVLHHEQPAVSMRMIVRAGSALDPKDKLGLASLAASLLTQGTSTQSANEMNEAIDFIGGAMGTGAGTDFSFLNVVVMKDSFDAGLKMLSDMARRPAFDPAEIDRQRQQVLSSLQVSFEDPEFVADAVFDRLVYGFHPYGLPQTGTPTTMAAINRGDLVDFHRRHFVPNNAILAIVGDLTAEEAFAAVTRAFGDWERKDVASETLISPPDPTRRVIVVDKPDAVQTEVRVGHLGVRRNHQDYMALNLALRILGGEGANRLHHVLRTERGLTYGAKADMDTLRESGDFEASTNTRSEATIEVLRLMVDQFWRMQREPVRERELADAKAYLTGSFPLTIEIPDAIATQVLNVLLFGLPLEELQSFRERVNAVTVDDIQRVSRAYLKPDRLSVVLVGNASTFASQLKGIGFGTFETVGMQSLDLTAANFRRSTRTGAALRRGAALADPASRRDQRIAYRPLSDASINADALEAQQTRESKPLAISPEEGAAATALLEKIVAAKGGLERLRALKNIKAVTRAEMRGTTDAVSSETVTYLEYPSRVRIETTMSNVSVVQAFDGSKAWVKDPNGVHDVPDQLVRELESGLKRDTVAILLAASDGTLRARALPDIKDEGGRRHRALEVSGPSLEPMVLYVDPDTYLIAKQAYVAGGVGAPLVEEVFGNYKTVDGVQIAFTATVRRGGRPMLVRRITEIVLNGPLDPNLFKRPAS
jgi:zinc protease